MFEIFREGHNLAFANPSRTPPDPTLFPNYVQNKQGLWLRWRAWWPRAVPMKDIRGVVFIVSGLGEWSGRYDSVALRLNTEGYVAFSVDNQGAGGSEGVRLYVEHFGDFADDIQLFAHHITILYPELTKLPRFLLGHSMGGLISTHVAMRAPDFFNGVILSGPAYASPAFSPGRFLRALVAFMSRWVPKLPAMALAAGMVSTNKPVVELVEQDPFYSNARLRARFGGEMLAAQDLVFASMEKSSFPFLLVHGEADPLCSVGKSREFYEAAVSKDKKMITYPNVYHEVLTEVCREQVLNDVMEFITKRTI